MVVHFPLAFALSLRFKVEEDLRPLARRQQGPLPGRASADQQILVASHPPLPTLAHLLFDSKLSAGRGEVYELVHLRSAQLGPWCTPQQAAECFIWPR